MIGLGSPLLRSWIDPRDLDAIDEAYLFHDHPLMIARVQDTAGDPKLWRELLSMIVHSRAVILPPGFDIEFIEPTHTHPWELARWADDGGRV